ncbi:hypothetical protein HG536_0C05290 [Torulaspora globosa]|uniref:Uncharacterized protein n=1 Tax=Torulaspora globosa TaxID=48254 RepID=A0A7G3ZFS4_9SACH|nr:uncharacterized protein HG536_0C05290 [Torulaspora globosa]QLL32360.1 hypothetical protein HG536_0C05290 [Torulaspora globosa]
MGEDSSSSEKAELLSKPWFQDAYKSAVDFYKRDEQLDARDRLELSKAYQSIARAQFLGGWLGFSCVFLPPFAYRYYKTNAVRGVRVPRNFMLGLLAMFVTTRWAGKYMYSRKLAGLDPDGSLASRSSYEEHDEEATPESKTSLQRQYEMMKLLDGGFPAKWAAYFYMTYQNPGRRLPNPEVKLEQLKSGTSGRPSSFMNQRDPLQLYSGPAFDKKDTWPGSNTAPNGEEAASRSSWDAVRQSTNAPGSSWDRVRQHNGSKPSRLHSTPEDRDEKEDVLSLDHPTQSEFDALLERERKGEDDEL